MRLHERRYHSATRRTLIGVGAIALLAAPPGCTWLRSLGGGDRAETAPSASPGRPTLDDSVQTYAGSVPGVLQPINRPIVQTELPLVYLVETAGTLRVTSVDTGEEIITLDAKPNQILIVESRGVSLANERVLGATLAPGKYAIYALSDDAGVVRSTQMRTQASVAPPAAAEAGATTPPTTGPTAIDTDSAPPADTPPPQ